jgi:signal transduction histidine kinase
MTLALNPQTYISKCRRTIVTDFRQLFLDKFPFYFTFDKNGNIGFLSPALEANGFNVSNELKSTFVIIEGSKKIEITIDQLQQRIGKVIILRSVKNKVEYFGELEFDQSNQKFQFLGMKSNFLSHSLFQKSLLELIQLAVFPIENPTPLLRIDNLGNLCYSNDKGVELWIELQNDLQQKCDIIRLAVSTLESRVSEQVQQTVANRIFDTIFVPDQTQDFVGIYFIDITKKIENEKLLESHRIKLISSSRLSALGEMASGISHEINNPMTVVLAQSQIMQKMLTSESLDIDKFKNSLQKIEKMSDRITKIINGLSSFSRDGNKDPMDSISIKLCIDHVLNLCEGRLKAMQLELSIDEPPNITFNGRAVQIEQVLLNLILNAAQATQHNERKWIRISFENRDHILFIHVIDSGCGISEDAEKKLMEPFYTTKAIGAGTGLGLSISLGIIQSHGGKLYLNRHFSTTCFTIELPLPEQKNISLRKPAA